MIEVRPLRPEEVAQQHAIEVASYPPAEAASLERFAARRERFPAGTIGAFEEGRLAAFLCAVRTSAADLGDEGIKAEQGDDPEGKDLVVLSIATAPGARRRGLGALLLEAFAIGAARLGFRRLRLLCKREMVAWYAKHGYRLLGESACRHGGAVWFEMERGAM